MSVHEDTLQGLQEALEYVKGNKTKARSMIISLPDNDTDMERLLFQKFVKLSEQNKQRAIGYIDGLLQVSTE